MYDTPDEAIACITGLGGQPCSKWVENPNRSSPAYAVMCPIATISNAQNLITI
jgi:hypothetical protein